MAYWHHSAMLPWEAPLAFAARYAGQDMALLYSGLPERFTGEYSYLFLTPMEVHEGRQWEALPVIPDGDDSLPYFVGYLGYEMGFAPENTAPSPVAMPAFRLVRYGHLTRFDHTKKVIEIFTRSGSKALPTRAAAPSSRLPRSLSSLTSNMTRTAYEAAVAATVEQIAAGNFYQANITRKFFGEFDHAPDSWQIFESLAKASPAPYSAYIRHGTSAILSSSPECFLRVGADGEIIARPIKGSARRGKTVTDDVRIQAGLKASAKNQAENLMIVDLMRNDLSRISLPGSVKVLERSALYSYATIHHLISTIRAERAANVSFYDIVHACFPPGSMTGAPKIAAMRWCAAKEGMARGVYSGAIGWFGAGERGDLSVTIRTLVIDGNRFEFQVGGGIVADSTPQEEWQETLVKARGICEALGIAETTLEAL